MTSEPHPAYHRVAYFPDSFHEVNGVAHTSRKFVAFARSRELPMLCVRAGKTTHVCETEGSVQAIELGRSPLAIPMERDLYFDPLFFRYSSFISEAVRNFRPDIIHITGPSELGLFGAYFAWKLNIPLVASWHTNVHEYAARRMGWFSRHLTPSLRQKLEATMEAWMLSSITWVYRRAKVLYAPNPGLCSLLEARTHRPCHLMQRGVDTHTFTPARRTRTKNDQQIVLGYVGRLSVEKNVALLPRVDEGLRQRGISVKWLIVGHGSEAQMLQRGLHDVTMTGVLRGDALAEAYANMDLLVFPSHTDTFGNVVLEALASGVPAIVTPDGGPASIVKNRETGLIAKDEDFAAAIFGVLSRTELFECMRLSARDYALQCSWDTVFERVVAAYPMPNSESER
jgi:glycosyltransferase involved in cell wall biosynthesis